MRARGWALAVFAVASLGFAGPAAARAVDLALVLAVDVSGSVNGERFELQKRGYAEAFASQEVIDAIDSGQNHAIAVTLVEWSGTDHQRQMISWTFVHDPISAAAFGSAVSETPRAFSDWTSISGAMDYAAMLFGDAEVEPVRRVIDISGDGINNNGRSITEARDAAVGSGITVNGLPILTEYPTLDAYYRDNVIGGPGAFAVVANDFSAFGSAILRKLVREIAGMQGPVMVISAAEPEGAAVP